MGTCRGASSARGHSSVCSPLELELGEKLRGVGAWACIVLLSMLSYDVDTGASLWSEHLRGTYDGRPSASLKM